jgi:hypothetical protein
MNSSKKNTHLGQDLSVVKGKQFCHRAAVGLGKNLALGRRKNFVVRAGLGWLQVGD